MTRQVAGWTTTVQIPAGHFLLFAHAVSFPRGVKRPEREDDHSPPTVEVKNAWSCTATPPYVTYLDVNATITRLTETYRNSLVISSVKEDSFLLKSLSEIRFDLSYCSCVSVMIHVLYIIGSVQRSKLGEVYCHIARLYDRYDDVILPAFPFPN